MFLFSMDSLAYALEGNLPHAFWLVGSALANGIGEHRNKGQAMKYLEQGMSLGSPLCKRDLALLMLADESSAKERLRCLRWLAECVNTGAANTETLATLMHEGHGEFRGVSVRWLQHELVFKSNWKAGFFLYTSVLFPNGPLRCDPQFLHDALLVMADEKPQARKALAFGLLSGALPGRAPVAQASRWLQRGTTANEIALAALVSLQHAGSCSIQRFVRAERSLFIASQAGSSVGNGLLLRLSMQQLENTVDPLARGFICNAAVEHLANFPMHADDESLRILIRWLGEDSQLRKSMEPRLRKVLMRSADLGLTSATVALARISLLDGAPSAAVDRLRSAALRGHAGAVQILAQPQMQEGNTLGELEGHFWMQLNLLRESAPLNLKPKQENKQPKREILYAVS